MGHYRSNLRDIFFNLFEVLGRDEMLGHGPYEDLDHDTAVAVLTEIEHLAATKLAESFASSDREPPTFDPRDQHAVRAARGVQGVLPRATWTPASTHSSCPASSAASRRRRHCSGR